MRTEKQKVIVIVPTYQEKQTIQKLIQQLLLVKPKINILVIDDNSPDMTWMVVREFAKKNKRVHLLLRKTNRGRGYAGRGGFKWALAHKAQYIIEMDADGSHDPKFIPKIIKALKYNDVVLGSRAVEGGKQINRPLHRRVITKFANAYIRFIFGIKVRDCNSGYRGFKMKVIKKINKQLTASGPDIIQEVLFLVHKYGFKTKEIPIEFRDREDGDSKLRLKHIMWGYLRVIAIKFRRYDD